ncbi:hypothetical protein [Psychrobacter urativorans]|uniref:Uncharacterized protein n=1 Tax=Psychrobacter urativorans TaxID=45610 RepID=A0A0M4SZF1_9GAMM|nr:hypothetical protein [Psychrobacter urativorans]ALF60572.1 hypothetical protein AOC03_11390 [Psychrobacter urativorans]
MLVFSWLAPQEKSADTPFECCLILEYNDESRVDVIDINDIKNDSKTWLDLVHKRRPLDNGDKSSKKSNNKNSLFLSYLIDTDLLLKEKPRLAHIYLWASTSARDEKIHLETVYPFSQLIPTSSLNLNKIFIQVYPILSDAQSSQKYHEIENQRIDSEGFIALLALIQEQPKKIIVTESPIPTKQSLIAKQPVMIKELITESESNQDASDDFNLEILDQKEEDVVWGIFSKQDLSDLVEGFYDWQRVHGKNTLIARLPTDLSEKISKHFDIVFWTSGQGISNMVVDNRPPRHTMVIGIIKTSGSDKEHISHGIGYCIQRPTSLDKMWTHQQWHRLECSDNEILTVTPIIL